MNLKKDSFTLSEPVSFHVASHGWLREIPSPPKVLNYLGSVQSLSRPCFAIVGTRRPSGYGVRTAIAFSKQLASMGFTIVSGLARGIDSWAHRGALMARGKTVAVLGHGLKRIYPPENFSLSQDILNSGGCLLSEYPLETPPLPHHFPQRNRIISGLCVGTLIIEAAEKSGSLITARYALEQNRSVFVVPSRIEDKSFTGGNLLLQEGAKLVLKLEDILEEIGGSYRECIEKDRKDDSDLLELKTLFETQNHQLCLTQILEASSAERTKLLAALDVAIKQEKVVEVAPQHYIWIT
ncbi:MAG: DNA-protecting protein DprA [Proteobacteria bacterium]|nr:DNA-protecting protein DprA [Pseudomonadota bacterium]